jgi:hypothetical protein
MDTGFMDETAQALLSAPFVESTKVILTEAVRRFRLPYSTAFVHSALGESIDEDSAEALVEAARAMGIQVKVGDIEPDQLLQYDPKGEEILALCGRTDGFVLYEGRDRNGAHRLWDSHQGRYTLSDQELENVWAGRLLVMTLNRTGATVREPWKHRFLNSFVMLDLTSLRLVAERNSPRVLASLFVLLTGMTAMGVWTSPTGLRLQVAGMALCFSLAWFCEYLLLRMQYSDVSRALEFCGGAGANGCRSLLAHRAGRIGLLPLSGLGWSVHTACLFSLAWGGVGGYWAAGIAGSLGVLLALRLLRVQFRERQFCRFCNTVHLCNLAAVLLFWSGVGSNLPGWGALLWGAGPFLAVFVLCVTGVLPHLMGADELKRFYAEQEREKVSAKKAIYALMTAPRYFISDYAGIPLLGEGAPLRGLLVADMSCQKCARAVRWSKALRRHLGPWVELKAVVLGDESAENSPAVAEMARTLMVVGMVYGPDAFLQAFLRVNESYSELLWVDDPRKVLRKMFDLDRAEHEPLFELADRQIDNVRAIAERFAVGKPFLVLEGRVLAEAFEAVLRNLPHILKRRPDLGEAFFGHIIATAPSQRKADPAPSPLTGIDQLVHTANTTPLGPPS